MRTARIISDLHSRQFGKFLSEVAALLFLTKARKEKRGKEGVALQRQPSIPFAEGFTVHLTTVISMLWASHYELHEFSSSIA